jgi:hypothetical protein
MQFLSENLIRAQISSAELDCNSVVFGIKTSSPSRRKGLGRERKMQYQYVDIGNEDVENDVVERWQTPRGFVRHRTSPLLISNVAATTAQRLIDVRVTLTIAIWWSSSLINR